MRKSWFLIGKSDFLVADVQYQRVVRCNPAQQIASAEFFLAFAS